MSGQLLSGQQPCLAQGGGGAVLSFLETLPLARGYSDIAGPRPPAGG
jgi:hypothetical protein